MKIIIALVHSYFGVFGFKTFHKSRRTSPTWDTWFWLFSIFLVKHTFADYTSQYLYFQQLKLWIRWIPGSHISCPAATPPASTDFFSPPAPSGHLKKFCSEILFDNSFRLSAHLSEPRGAASVPDARLSIMHDGPCCHYPLPFYCAQATT